ncbi:DUF1579 family protein [Micromonospora sp. NPDC093277]|uniref:DUF1579 family protein n=1 Tax=Micromonospora sp. NPDC093277 TaxID=3364291 RepID=UPI0037F648F4
MNSRKAAVPGRTWSRLRRGLALGATAVLGAMVLGAGAPSSAAPESFPDLSDNAFALSRSAAPPPAQMRQLDFMLGNWKCVVTTQMHGQPPETGTTYVAVRKILGGHWYELRSLQMPTVASPQRLVARQVYGWDPVAQQFTTYYYDDADGQGAGTAPQVTAGHAVFTGTYLFNGFRHIGRDDLYSPGPGKLYNDISMGLESAPEELFPVGTSRCTRH